MKSGRGQEDNQVPPVNESPKFVGVSKAKDLTEVEKTSDECLDLMIDTRRDKFVDLIAADTLDDLIDQEIKAVYLEALMNARQQNEEESKQSVYLTSDAETVQKHDEKSHDVSNNYMKFSDYFAKSAQGAPKSPRAVSERKQRISERRRSQKARRQLR